MSDLEYFKGSKNPKYFVKSFVHDVRFYQDNPFYLSPSGIWCFCGAQGSGKTLSAVKCVKRLIRDYPGAVLVSNIALKGIDFPVIPFTSYEQIVTMDNSIFGIIFLLDELHLLWNSLESKKVPFEELAAFCQMRKNRRIIVGTSQVYGRIAKPIREQLKYVITCRNYLKYLQVNTIIDPNADDCRGEHDGELEGQVIGREWFFHSPADYESYNTLFRVERLKRG